MTRRSVVVSSMDGSTITEEVPVEKHSGAAEQRGGGRAQRASVANAPALALDGGVRSAPRLVGPG